MSPHITEYVLAAIAIVSAIVAAVMFFRGPDEVASKDIAVLVTRADAFDKALDKLLTNDIPHLDAKLDAMAALGAEHDRTVSANFAKVFTILDERIPKRK